MFSLGDDVTIDSRLLGDVFFACVAWCRVAVAGKHS